MLLAFLPFFPELKHASNTNFKKVFLLLWLYSYEALWKMLCSIFLLVEGWRWDNRSAQCARSLGRTDLKRHGELHDVKVHIVQLQGLQGGLQGGPHQLWGVACGPQLEEEEETGGRGTVRETPGNVREGISHEMNESRIDLAIYMLCVQVRVVVHLHVAEVLELLWKQRKAASLGINVAQSGDITRRD